MPIAAILPAIASIYGPAVGTSVATFDLTDPPNSDWKHKISSSVSGDHVLVVEDGPDVVGYAYSGAFRSRPAYAQTRETSVYLAPEAVGAGLGTLLSQLLSLLRTDGIHLVVALFSRVVAGHSQLDANIVVTVGREIDPAELGKQPTNVRIDRFVPRQDLLPHCDVVVSHAGSGSVIGALAFGVPLVLLPMGAGQPLNSDRCQSLGVARVLDPLTVTSSDIRSGVAEVLRASIHLPGRRTTNPGRNRAPAHLRRRHDVDRSPPPDPPVP